MELGRDRKIAHDCSNYLGDRPCAWHKQKKFLCECEHYRPVRETILIIKLDAMGDVLRTTSLLPVMARKWPEAQVIWITRQESIPLLRNNPYIKETIPYGSESLLFLSCRSFDRVINLDAGKISSGMIAMAKAKEKIGYVLLEQGYVVGTNAAADDWLRMGIFDDLKRANKKSYQEIMCSILGLPLKGLQYVMQLTDLEVQEGQRHLKKIGIDPLRPVIGIHTGGGGRWKLKQWSEDKFIALLPELLSKLGKNTQIVIFGGPLERDLNHRIIKSSKGNLFDAGCDNDVRHFAALVNQCSVLLTGDTLAMHIALAMGRRSVVLFGPTSNTEIELFGLGEKIIPDMDCLSCYKQECDRSPNCMDLISVDMVVDALIRQLNFVT